MGDAADDIESTAGGPPENTEQTTDSEESSSATETHVDQHEPAEPCQRTTTSKGMQYRLQIKGKNLTAAFNKWKRGQATSRDVDDYIGNDSLKALAQEVESAYEELATLLEDEDAKEKSAKIVKLVQNETTRTMEEMDLDDIDIHSTLDELLEQLPQETASTVSMEKFDNLNGAIPDHRSPVLIASPQPNKNASQEDSNDKIQDLTKNSSAPTRVKEERTEISYLAAVVDRLEMPRGKISTFDGSPQNYHQFTLEFDSAIGSRNVGADTKLKQLVQHCIGRAYDAIKPCLLMPSGEGYQAALKILENRFGDPLRIARAIIKELTSGPQIKSNAPTQLQAFSDQVQSCLWTLKALEKTNEINTQDRMAEIVDRLPYHGRTR
jgi:hypothetical protein